MTATGTLVRIEPDGFGLVRLDDSGRTIAFTERTPITRASRRRLVVGIRMDVTWSETDREAPVARAIAF